MLSPFLRAHALLLLSKKFSCTVRWAWVLFTRCPKTPFWDCVFSQAAQPFFLVPVSRQDQYIQVNFISGSMLPWYLTFPTLPAPPFPTPPAFFSFRPPHTPPPPRPTHTESFFHPTPIRRPHPRSNVPKTMPPLFPLSRFCSPFSPLILACLDRGNQLNKSFTFRLVWLLFTFPVYRFWDPHRVPSRRCGGAVSFSQLFPLGAFPFRVMKKSLQLLYISFTPLPVCLIFNWPCQPLWPLFFVTCSPPPTRFFFFVFSLSEAGIHSSP